MTLTEIRPWSQPCGEYIAPQALGTEECARCGNDEHDHPETGEGH